MIPSPRSCHTARDVSRRKPLTAGRAALVLVTTLGLLGCTDGGTTPEPERTATEIAVTPDPTPTPSPTRSARPERPTAMDEVSVDGAIAAATYFISLYPYVYNTGDLTEWNALSHPECSFCATVNAEVNEMSKDGNHLEGATVVVDSASSVEIEAGYWFSAELDTTQEGYVEYDSLGNRVGEAAGSRLLITFALIRESDTWLIREASPSSHEG